jgi:putative transposase
MSRGLTPGHVTRDELARAERRCRLSFDGGRVYGGRMPRPLRIQAAGAIYHVMARGNRRQEIYVERGDYERFLTICADVVDRSGWRCHGYCLMPNHYHLVIETPDANLSAGIQRLNGRYAQRFNWWHGLDGHLFQGRFQAVLLERTWHLVELVR